MRLSDVGELGLLAELERRGLARGIEDDAAQLGDGFVVTQDALVEDVHFRLEWTTHRELGYKAAAVNLSDLAASGATPEALLVTLAAPAETRLDDVLELYEGLNEPGVPVVGGDTTRSAKLQISVTALGRSARREPPSGRAGMHARRCGSRKAAAWPRSLTPSSTSPTGSRSTPRTSRAARVAASRSSSSEFRWRRARRSTTCASARTTSCSRPPRTRSASP